jgi:superfamily II DNA or RNA helicase
LGHLKAKYRYGLSATLDRRDGLMPIIFRGIGPVITTIEKSEVEDVGSTVPAIVHVVKTGFSPNDVNSWADYLSEITASAERNQIIVDLAKNAKGSVLILCDRVAHAEQLSAMLARREIDHVLVHGDLKKVDRFDAMARIKTADITIGTSGLLSEGIDVASWEVLIMGSPISSEIKLMQSLGRIVRSAKGKERGVVYDLRDDCGFAGASFKNRLGIYQNNNIKVNFGIESISQNNQNAPWRSLKPTEKQITFLKSTGCENIDKMTRGEAADLIGSGRVKKAG